MIMQRNHKRNHVFFAALLMGCLVLSVFSKTAHADTRSEQPSFLHNLRLGSTGADVERLQHYLNNNGAPIALSGPGSVGNETAYFGPATSRAVVRFQELHSSAILSPFGRTKGTGNFFTATRNFINQLLSQMPGAGEVTPPAPVPVVSTPVIAPDVSNPVTPPSEATYTVGGTAIGLIGSVMLENNGGDELTVHSLGSGHFSPFTFAEPLTSGQTYSITIKDALQHPECNVSFQPKGIVKEENITSVRIICGYGGGAPTQEIFGYVTPLSPDALNTSHIQRYVLSANGLLSFSENATQTDGHYGKIAFATVNGTQYAYILEDGVTYCSVAADGTFTNCAQTSAPISGMNHPRDIAFATVNGTQYAYLSDPSSSSLFQCAIGVNGNLSSCSEYTDGNIDAALGIAFTTDENGVQHAYVADAAMGMVVCPIDVDGSFMNPPGCATTPSLGIPEWVPYGIAFATLGGTSYAYVADNGVDANLGHVYRCRLNIDGTFQDHSCVATPTDTSSFAPWNPSSVAVKTVKGTSYAYVVNNQGVNIGNIYRCAIDETTGLLTEDCIETPDLPASRDTWQPSGISFR